MSRRSLTPAQMADILMQSPGRLTAGVLEQRTSYERFRDDHLLFINERPFPRDFLTRVRGRLSLEFNRQCYVRHPHERSLADAARELRMIGFSHNQIRALKDSVYEFCAGPARRGDLGRLVNEKFPDLKTGTCDDAFLGTAVKDNDDINDFFYRLLDLRVPVHPREGVFNSMFPRNAEPLARDALISHMESLNLKNPDLFLPAHNVKRYNSLMHFPKNF